MTAALQLSSPQQVADWLGGAAGPVAITGRLIQSLDAAREIVTAEVSAERVARHADDNDGRLPAQLHRAATMVAAQLESRSESVYGVEAYSLGGDAGAYIGHDPAIDRLLRRWRTPSIGAAPPGGS